MSKMIEVDMASFAVADKEAILATRGVGSCVVVTLYDPVVKVGGLAHSMLPSRIDKQDGELTAKYVDEAIEIMVEQIDKIGGIVQNLKAKLIGGSKMFKILGEEKFGVGEQNIRMAKAKLEELGIDLESEDTGGTIGRSIEFNLETGLVSVVTKM